MTLIWWAALLARLALSVIPGLSWDVNSHLAWSQALAHHGPASFYGSLWCDYPPGYLYVLWGIGWLDRALIPAAAPGLWHYVLLKVPAILADLGIGLLLLRWVRERRPDAAAGRLALAWVLNPAVWLISAVWGQADSVFTLWVLLAMYGLGRPGTAARLVGAALYGLALLTKPQAVLFLPLLVLWMAARRYRFTQFVQAATVAATVMALLAWPFAGPQRWDWLFRLYRTAADQYRVTSANAFNVWALIGLWRPDSGTWLGLPYVGWGMAATAACAGWICWRLRRSPSLEAFMLAGAALILSCFLFLTRMHERYAYYALPFLLAAAVLTGRRRWWAAYAGVSSSLVLNLGYTLWYYAPIHLRQPMPLEPLTRPLYEGRWLSIAVGCALLGLWAVVMRGVRQLTAGLGDAPGLLPKWWRLWAARSSAPAFDRWVAAGLFAAALSLYLVRLGVPAEEHYDEVHHLKTARQFLQVKEPTEWTHPHLGKLAMAASIGLLGDRSFAWRLPGALVGSCTIALIYLLGVSLGGSRFIGGCAALLLLFDGLQFVISRIAMVDVYVTCFSLLAYLVCVRSFVMAWRPTRRAWLTLGAALGLALSSKWIAFYTYGAVLCLLATAWWRARRRGDPAPECRWPVFAHRIFVFLVLVPLSLYLLTYARYIQTGHSLTDLVFLQQSMWNYHAKIAETHLYSSPWWSWPLIWRPVWTYFHPAGDGRIEGIVLLGNPAVFWVGLPCLLMAAWWVLRRRDGGLGVIVAAFCFQYLPWGISLRKLVFFHHIYSALPWLCLAIAACLRRLWGRPDTRWMVGAYLAVVVGLFWYFYPLLSAWPVSDAAFRARMWFPRWI